MSAIKQFNPATRKLYIDWNEFSDSRITEDRYGYTAYQIATILGPRRRFSSPQLLQQTIDEYFASHLGVALTRSGMPILDHNSNPVIRTTIPLTMSGLARHLGVTTRALMEYKYQAVQRGIPEEYLPILNQARQRIEEYSEQRLYDNDGSKGATFALAANFGWETPKERSERKALATRTKLAEAESKVKISAMEAGEGDGSGIHITITRAGRREDLLDGDALGGTVSTDGDDCTNLISMPPSSRDYDDN